MKNKNLLETAFIHRFGKTQATYLARLFETGLSVDILCYEEINLPKEQKDDSILIAYEERMLIPVRSGRSSTWEDRILSLCPEEKYFIPPVVQYFIKGAIETGKFDGECAVKHALVQHFQENVDWLLQLFRSVCHHAVSYTVEAGLIEAIKNKIGLPIDLHDVIDLFVALGILSPCIRGPMTTGLYWYEINPCLYWK